MDEVTVDEENKTLVSSAFWDELLSDLYFMLTLMVASAPASVVHMLESANSSAIMMLQSSKKKEADEEIIISERDALENMAYVANLCVIFDEYPDDSAFHASTHFIKDQRSGDRYDYQVKQVRSLVNEGISQTGMKVRLLTSLSRH